VLSLLSFLCRTQCLLFITSLNPSLLISLSCASQCLGELALPNLTDQMKATSLCKEPGTSWRFILERIPVTKHHVDISQVLVKFLKQTKQVGRLSVFASMEAVSVYAARVLYQLMELRPWLQQPICQACTVPDRPICIQPCIVFLRNFMCYFQLTSLLQEKAAEHAADSRRQFNMLPVGFKGFREAQEGTGRDFIAVCSFGPVRLGLVVCVRLLINGMFGD
jgi:hypothetical protein